MDLVTVPPGFGFMLDKDQHNQPRLRWGFPGLIRRGLHYAFAAFLIAVAAVPGVCFAAAFPAGEWKWLMLPCWIAMSAWLLVYVVIMCVLLQLTDPGPPASIVLSEAYLLYHPGGKRLAEHHGRWRLSNVRVDCGEGRQRLLLDIDGNPLEIGESLSTQEREWLAAVLTSWVPAPKVTQLGQEEGGAELLQ